MKAELINNFSLPDLISSKPPISHSRFKCTDVILDATIVHRRLIAVKRVPRLAHDLAGFGNIAQFFSQIQQAYFEFDDLLVIIQHHGFLLSWFRLHQHQNGNHHLKQVVYRHHSSSLKWGRVR